jgi:hypothetical protein
MPFLNYVLNLAGHDAKDYALGSRLNLYGTDYIVCGSADGTQQYFEVKVTNKMDIVEKGIIVTIGIQHYIITYDEIFQRMMANEVNMLEIAYYNRYVNKEIEV